MQMPPTNIDSENLEFISGAFHPYAWLRTLNASYSITDPTKDARIKFKTGDDLYLLLFNKPVDLKFTEKSLVVDQFHQNSRHLVFIDQNFGDIYDKF